MYKLLPRLQAWLYLAILSLNSYLVVFSAAIIAGLSQFIFLLE